MRLTVDQIKNICVGALRVQEEADGIHFYKCTDKQIDVWKSRSDFLHNGARATTGVRLDFHTNSKHLTLSLAQGNKTEIFLDGQFRYQFFSSEYREKKEPIQILLNNSRGEPQEELRVTVCLPSHEIGVLEFIELDDGATIEKHSFDRKILFFGDSITQGWNSSLDSFSWTYRVSRFFNADSVMQGIGGAYYWSDSFDVIPYDPDIVIIAYGTNDAFKLSLDEERANTSAFLDQVVSRYKAKKIFVISPIWRGHSDGRPMEDSFTAYRTVIESEVSKRSELILIPGLELLPPVSTFYADTHLHPNMLGFGVYAENVIRIMQQYL